MTIKEFASIVQDMRRNQKKFFETRDPYYLKLSKDLEKKVDRKVEEIINPETDLFTKGEAGPEMVAHAINNTIKNAKEELGMETDLISDGHHTFGDLYETIDSLCGKSEEWIFEKGKGLVARQYFEDNFESI